MQKTANDRNLNEKYQNQVVRIRVLSTFNEYIFIFIKVILQLLVSKYRRVNQRINQKRYVYDAVNIKDYTMMDLVYEYSIWYK